VHGQRAVVDPSEAGKRVDLGVAGVAGGERADGALQGDCVLGVVAVDQQDRSGGRFGIVEVFDLPASSVADRRA